MASGVIQYTPLGRRDLKRASRAVDAPDTGEAELGVLVAGSEADVARLLRLVRTLLDQGSRDEQLMELLLQDVQPRVMEPEHLEQLRLQAKARAAFLTEVPLLTSREVGELLGSTAENTSAMASRLKRGNRLFALTHRGVDLYPAAQIVGGEPSPAMEGILKAFEGEPAWTVALWLHAPSGWLGGRRPLDVLAEDPGAVAEAACRTTAPLAV
jgi:hypothetical protein